MPIYEYLCSACNHHFDLMQKMSDKPATQCPKCFEQTAQRLISAPAFQLKGSGWYATDYKKPSGDKSGDSAVKTDSGSSDSKA